MSRTLNFVLALAILAGTAHAVSPRIIRLDAAARFSAVRLPDGRVGLSAMVPQSGSNGVACTGGVNISAEVLQQNGVSVGENQYSITQYQGANVYPQEDSAGSTTHTPCVQEDDSSDQPHCLTWGTPTPVATHKIAVQLQNDEILWAQCSRAGAAPISREELQAALKGFLIY